jgi:hypothetical protein
MHSNFRMCIVYCKSVLNFILPQQFQFNNFRLLFFFVRIIIGKNRLLTMTFIKVMKDQEKSAISWLMRDGKVACGPRRTELPEPFERIRRPDELVQLPVQSPLVRGALAPRLDHFQVEELTRGALGHAEHAARHHTLADLLAEEQRVVLARQVDRVDGGAVGDAQLGLVVSAAAVDGELLARPRAQLRLFGLHPVQQGLVEDLAVVGALAPLARLQQQVAKVLALDAQHAPADRRLGQSLHGQERVDSGEINQNKISSSSFRTCCVKQKRQSQVLFYVR